MKKAVSKILILIIIAIIVVGGFFVWKKWGNRHPNKSSEIIPGQPPDYIQIEETPKGQIVKNTQKNISIVVPKGWEANPFVADEDLEIRKFGEGQTVETHLVDGVVMDFHVQDNLEGLSIQEWIENSKKRSTDLIAEEQNKGIGIEIIETKNIEPLVYENWGNKTVAKSVNAVYGEIGFIEDGEELTLAFTHNNKIITIICTCVGPKFKEYRRECENIIKNNIIYEFQ